jgi:hypothetical protein
MTMTDEERLQDARERLWKLKWQLAGQWFEIAIVFAVFYWLGAPGWLYAIELMWV